MKQELQVVSFIIPKELAKDFYSTCVSNNEDPNKAIAGAIKSYLELVNLATVCLKVLTAFNKEAIKNE